MDIIYAIKRTNLRLPISRRDPAISCFFRLAVRLLELRDSQGTFAQFSFVSSTSS